VLSLTLAACSINPFAGSTLTPSPPKEGPAIVGGSPNGSSADMALVGVDAPASLADAQLIVRLRSDPQTAEKAAIEVLADAGIAVYDQPSSSSPVQSVLGSESPVKLLRWQVRTMADELSNSGTDGIEGRQLDADLTMPPNAPPFSYVVAAWLNVGTSRAAQLARGITGPQNWSHASDLVYPTLVLTLFTSDMTGEIGKDTTGAPAPSNVTLGPTPSQTGFTANPIPTPTSAQPGPAAAELDYLRTPTPVTALVGSGPCSDISAFLTSTLDGIAASLKVDPSALGNSVAGQIGGFFANVWNAVVAISKSVVAGVVDRLTAPIVNAIRAAVGLASVLASVVSLLKPANGVLTAHGGSLPGPDSFVIASTGDSPHRYLELQITTSLDTGYPSFIQDCASATGVQLPTLSAEGSTVTWLVNDADHTITVTAPAGPPYQSVSFASGHAYLQFDVGFESADDATSPDQVQSQVIVKAQFANNIVRQIYGLVRGFLTGQISGVIGTLVNPIIAGFLDAANSRLSTLINEPSSATISFTVGHGAHVTCTS
jgi:hypothetical protein